MDKENIIEFVDFSFTYFSQKDPTLYNIDLKIKKGEKVLIIGPSGSGKSTLGHCVNGLIPFSYKGDILGSLKVNGKSTEALDIFSISKTVGSVLQDSDGQFVGLTVGEDIAFSLENDNVDIKTMKEKVKEAASLVNMEDELESSPYELSGGQKQRTAIAGVLVNDVELLLFDEPLANLDPVTGYRAIEIIDSIHKSTNKTVLIIEHRIEEVLQFNVDRVILVNDGKILANMTANEILSSSLLAENGIREPLYLSGLKYLGLDIKENINPSSIENLRLDRDFTNYKPGNHSELDSNNSDTILKLEGIGFSYTGEKDNLNDINIDIKKGEMISIAGKNGAGKSTLAKIICGFESQDRGKIYYENVDMERFSIKERAEKIGFVLQNPNQMISKQFIYDEVALGLQLRAFDEEYIDKKIEEVLKICGLEAFIDWPISALSYGQKKRLTIASILVLDPKVIILDEPTAGQDYKHYTEIMEFLLEINKMGITVIFITHDMHLMLEYTNRAIVLVDGKVLVDDKPYKILTDEKITRQANLKETSLYSLASKLNISDKVGFVKDFIYYEREKRLLNEE